MDYSSLKKMGSVLLFSLFLLCQGIGWADAPGVLVPLYVTPTQAIIQPLLDAKSQHPSVPMRVILNPNAGVGKSQSATYVQAITSLKAAGIQVAGYVLTDYNTRSSSDVMNEIDQWYTWYKPDGIFLDVMGAMPSYYQGLTTYIKSLGMTFSIGSPGMLVDTSYATLVDTVVIANSSSLPTLSNYTNWQNAKFPITDAAFLLYNASTFPTALISSAKSFVGWFYITNQSDANPWDLLSPYLSQLLVALDTGSTPPPPTNPGKVGTMVPFYLDPTTSSIQPLLTAKQKYPNVPMRVILNPNSGPGSSKNKDYTNAITKLRAAGISILGYVHTSYGTRSLTTVKNEISQWYTWYQPDGIFLDEMGLNHPYYTSVTAYAKGLGIQYVVGNPGENIDISAGNDVDTVTVFEDSSLPTLSQFKNWYTAYPPSKIALLSYSISALPTSFVTQAGVDFAWIYITDDGADGNPWDELSTYFLNFVGLLNSL
jgi:Spherulation-specific family 4